MFESPNVVQGDNAEHVNALLLLSLQPQDRGAFRGLERGLVLEAHVGSYLAEYACWFHRWLRVYEYAPAAEHVLVKRERRGSKDTQDVRQVERRVGVRRQIQYVEAP